MVNEELIQQLAMQQAMGGSMIPPNPAPEMQEFSLGGDAGLSTREALYQQLKNRQSALTDQRSQAIAELGRPTSMSNSETVAMLLIGLLPSLVGGVVKGKEGVGIGGKAGAIGSQALAQGIEADAGRRRLQAQQNLQGIDEQINDLQGTASKAQLDEINAQDTASQKALDREATLGAAAIRAGGDRAVGAGLAAQAKQMSLDIKELTKNKETADQEARTRPRQIGASIIVPSTAMTDEGRKKIETEAADYAKVVDYTEKLLAEMDKYSVPEAALVDDKALARYNTLRESLVKAVSRIEKPSGSLGTSFAEQVTKELPNPASIKSSINSRLNPFSTTIKQKLQEKAKIAMEDMNYLVQSMAAEHYRLGTQQIHPTLNVPIYLKGISPTTGKPQWTDNIDEVNSILQKMELPLLQQGQ